MYFLTKLFSQKNLKQYTDLKTNEYAVGKGELEKHKSKETP